MYPIIKTMQIKTNMGMKLKNICFSSNGKEIVYHIDGYHYLNKDKTISKRRCVD